MRRLPSLLRRLYRALNPDPRAYVAMRVSHDDGGTIAIVNATLTAQALTTPQPPPLILNLAPPVTLRDVAAALAAAGWTVDDLTSESRDRGAITLIERPPSNASPLLAHDSLLWALMDAYAVELDAAAEAVAAAPAQLTVQTAQGSWLDELGRYYGTARLPDEGDATYAERLVAEVLRPKSNNVAMAAIIRATTGQPTIVRDVTAYGDTVPIHDASIVYDGAHLHNASPKAIHGLFDVETTYDLLGGSDIAGFRSAIIAQVERLRAAGTLLRQTIIASTGSITEAASGPQTDPADTQGMDLRNTAVLTDEAAAPAEAALLRLDALDTAEIAGGAEDTSLPAVTTATLADAAVDPADAALTTGAALAAMSDTAASPDDTNAIPLDAAPLLADTPTEPADRADADAVLAVVAETAAGPNDTAALPLSTAPVLSDAAAEPTEAVAGAAAAALIEPVTPPADDGVLTESYSHTLDGTWLLDGTRPLASGIPLTAPL